MSATKRKKIDSKGYKNKTAFQAVIRGLEQASKQQFVDDPRSSKDAKLAKNVKENRQGKRQALITAQLKSCLIKNS